MPIAPHIQVDGLKELQRDLRKAQGKLPDALGDAHKTVGKWIIGRLPEGDPHAVGQGAGSKYRASATKRELIIRVGGPSRSERAEERHVPAKYIQWGQDVQPFASGRPYLIGHIEQDAEEIAKQYLHTIKVYLADYVDIK